MPIFRKPPAGAVKERHRLSGAWSAPKKRKSDPDHTAYPRLSLKSTKEIEIAFGIDLHKEAYVVEFDTERKGIWICLVPLEAAERGAAHRFYYEKKQTRLNFTQMTGQYKSMGTERHNVFVEVWSMGNQYWLFADMSQHTELLHRFLGTGIAS